jgi:hypothetical protein
LFTCFNLDVKSKEFQNLGRLTRRDVLIVETKTTVNSHDIYDLLKKRKAINENYENDSKRWNYTLDFKTWLIACYGWDDNLKNRARRNDIVPIDDKELTYRLRSHNLLDGRRPPCP